jgi:hypothetical protein
VQHGVSANGFLPFCKKYDRKKTTKRGLCGSHKKDRASHEVRMVGIFCGWGLPCGAARNYLSGLPDLFHFFYL